MLPKIEIIPAFTIAGCSASMTMAQNSTAQLWQNFLKIRRNNPGEQPTEMISAAVYPANFFENFDPNATFTKWAGARILRNENSANELTLLNIAQGKYAIFEYVGNPAKAAPFFQAVFSQ